jgi:hypothetical protein
MLASADHAVPSQPVSPCPARSWESWSQRWSRVPPIDLSAMEEARLADACASEPQRVHEAGQGCRTCGRRSAPPDESRRLLVKARRPGRFAGTAWSWSGPTSARPPASWPRRACGVTTDTELHVAPSRPAGPVGGRFRTAGRCGVGPLRCPAVYQSHPGPRPRRCRHPGHRPYGLGRPVPDRPAPRWPTSCRPHDLGVPPHRCGTPGHRHSIYRLRWNVGGDRPKPRSWTSSMDTSKTHGTCCTAVRRQAGHDA